ncbi:MAG TPA: type II toxin-antitoxin system PemK/MazF family toxin [Mariniphaga anaerophila]|jgi:mRNA interferase MazF|uniref:Type II toxin-antitoxin system PemK/MazF family toxin n=1 Tax=Mariniphaga anaerophila TaxID=1484053 RepID=A0A831LK50_9BACT|nr:type II toxin-antitoxin system PemK/MazF family toxin [Mariniphaga anaerophila]
MKYKKGDIVIIAFPFTDLSNTRKRPALIISNDKVNNTGDYLMVQITSKMRNDSLSFPLSKPNFVNSKELPLQSCIRLHKIFLLNESLIISRNTAVNERFLDLVIEKITELIK